MEARVKWLENLTFTGMSGTGHGVVMDGDRDNGFGPSPMEMLLLGIGGCSSIDVVHILKRVVKTSLMSKPTLRPNAQKPTRRSSPKSTCTSR